MRTLAIVSLTALMILAGASGGGARAAVSKVRYTLTVTFVESGGWYEAYDAGGWRRGVRHAAYVLKSASPFWITRTPGAEPAFTGGTSLVGTGGYGLYREWWGPVQPGWTWHEYLFPAGGLVGHAALSGRGSTRASVAFTIAASPPTREIVHYSTGTTSHQHAVWLRGKGGTSPAFDLRRNFGRAFTARISKPVVSTTPRQPGYVGAPVIVSYVSHALSGATLVFRPVGTVVRHAPRVKQPERREPERQRWQVDVSGTDHWARGVLTGLRAGVDVDWLHRTTLDVEDGRIVGARGKVSVQDVRPFSEPAGVFAVTSSRTTRPAYELPAATKSGSRVTLNYFDQRGRGEYRVAFTARLTGPKALEIMRRAGLPDPEVRYRGLVDAGPLESTAATFVPDPARLVFLLRPGVQKRSTEAFDEQVPCPKAATGQDCYLARGGQVVAVTRLR